MRQHDGIMTTSCVNRLCWVSYTQFGDETNENALGSFSKSSPQNYTITRNGNYHRIVMCRIYFVELSYCYF